MEESSSSSSNGNFDLWSASSIRDFITVLALSFHSVFEGLAVGLGEDTSDVWQLFGGEHIIHEKAVLNCNVLLFPQRWPPTSL